MSRPRWCCPASTLCGLRCAVLFDLEGLTATQMVCVLYRRAANLSHSCMDMQYQHLLCRRTFRLGARRRGPRAAVPALLHIITPHNLNCANLGCPSHLTSPYLTSWLPSSPGASSARVIPLKAGIIPRIQSQFFYPQNSKSSRNGNFGRRNTDPYFSMSP
jgi:hypothetical protein